MKTLGNATPGTQGEAKTEEELNSLTVAKLKTLARENGITLTATTKAAIIAEILEALN